MKYQVKQGDRYRSILTDLIPYEVPVRFSFLHFHQMINDVDSFGRWIKRLNESKCVPKSCIPYLYSIKQDSNRSRTLGLIHPLLLKSGAELISDFDHAITNLCSKSSWSLRRPARVAKMYYLREEKQIVVTSQHASSDDGDDSESQEVGIISEQGSRHQDLASSYFVYEPFNLLQRFFDSKMLVGIEKRYSKCRRFDVAKCFNNIYSHSISWAIKSKTIAKKEIGSRHTIDARLDNFMQRSNHGETHGILIGSELSRIFAEIILQEIDIRVSEGLQSVDSPERWPNGLVNGKEYTVKRYIDDYFLFFNDESVADLVQNAIERHLSVYKLYLNEKKTEILTRPFITELSVAKRAIKRSLTSWFELSPDMLVTQDNSDGVATRQRFRSSQIISDLRQTFVSHKIDISTMSPTILQHISNMLKKKLGLFAVNGINIRVAQEWLESVFEVSFYLLSVDIRYRSCVIVGRMISDISEAFSTMPGTMAAELEEQLLKHSTRLLQQVVETGDINRMEITSFLICLKSLPNHNKIPEVLLETLVGDGLIGDDLLDYFTVISLIYFTESFAVHRDLIEASVKRILRAQNVMSNTELFCLSLDLLSCPTVPASDKRDIAITLIRELGTPNPSESDINSFVGEFSQRIWFFDWRANVSNRVYLMKKELSISY